MNRLAYSAVIVTRNRRDALSLSLPLLIQQSRAPSEIIIVDSSDDHDEIADLVRACEQEHATSIKLVKSGPGMTKQRNIGLSMVKSPVVLFPDDDSLLYSDAMEHIMQVYEADHARLVGGVCAAAASQPPPETNLAQNPTYRMAKRDYIKRWLLPIVRFFNEKAFKDPFILQSERLYEKLEVPDWLEKYNAVAVPYMGGFRMSFWTESIRKYGFNEYLGRYAKHEDILASLQILNEQTLVGAKNAQICHYKSPDRRDNGRTMGVIELINRPYIILHLRDVDRKMKRRHHFHNAYKIMMYLGTAYDRFGRERFLGALASYFKVSKILNSSPKDMDAVYLSVRRSLKIND